MMYRVDPSVCRSDIRDEAVVLETSSAPDNRRPYQNDQSHSAAFTVVSEVPVNLI